jgi:hypothetical protein
MAGIVIVILLGGLVLGGVPLAVMIGVNISRNRDYAREREAQVIDLRPNLDPWTDRRAGYGVSGGWYSCPNCDGKPCARCVQRKLGTRRRRY